LSAKRPEIERSKDFDSPARKLDGDIS